MPDIQRYTYHCHTNFSDGHNSPEEMVAQAKKIGFTEIGITDHLIVHKDVRKSFADGVLRKKEDDGVYNSDFKKILPRFQKHCEHLRHLSRSENFKISIGFEVDFFTYNGWFDEFKWFMSQLDYDYLITGNHMFFDENGENMFDMDRLKNVCRDAVTQKAYISRHFEAMTEAIESKMFKFLAHLDYVRRVGDDLCGPEQFRNDKLKVIKALRDNSVGMEISTKGLRKLGDFYPDGWVLDRVAEEKVAVIISDDAHRTTELGADFAKAEQEILKHNIHSRIVF